MSGFRQSRKCITRWSMKILFIVRIIACSTGFYSAAWCTPSISQRRLVSGLSILQCPLKPLFEHVICPVVQKTCISYFQHFKLLHDVYRSQFGKVLQASLDLGRIVEANSSLRHMAAIIQQSIQIWVGIGLGSWSFSQVLQTCLSTLFLSYPMSCFPKLNGILLQFSGPC